ncbi:MAG: glycyl-radical enzyme activating protein [Spirochaetaceae bacterium]|jgi:pyruvate-formate lyase-activating enzyme|nr:glycyl-radical enzyme activating protein [Spirochaetaceae bacterium]
MGRYEQAAWEALKTAETPEQQRALLQIAGACGHIKSAPPAHLFEAIQAFILLQEMILSENYSGSMSLGRVDQLFGPYYEKDKAAELIDFDQAGIMIDALWLKLAGLVLGFQNATVGGIDAQGNSAVNDITLLCLQASRKLRQDQPLLSLRVHKGMSDACWEEAQALIIQGGGFPALFNDDVVIPAREQQGVNKRDSWNYGLVGCVEPSIVGNEITVEALIEQLIRNQKFYDHSGGGVTLSGGEPLLQSDFCAAVLRHLKKRHIHTALDTAGNITWPHFEMVLPWVDLFLFDIKLIDPDRHLEMTKGSNRLILENFDRLCRQDIAIWVRTPIIEGINDGQIETDGRITILKKAKNIRKIELLPYHSYGVGKYAAMGMSDTCHKFQAPSPEKMQAIIARMQDRGIKNVVV